MATSGRGHGDHRRRVEGHQHLGVGDVAVQHRGTQATGDDRHLVEAVGDPVDVDVAPGELEPCRPSSGSVSGTGSQPNGAHAVALERDRY